MSKVGEHTLHILLLDDHALFRESVSRLLSAEIATRIGVSEGSVKSTLQQLFSKTGVRTRSQLVRIVLEQYRDQI